MTELLANTASAIALTSAGVFFFVGLLTGAWKYFSMVSSENYRSPFYVDMAHRASLMYAFGAMIIAVFAYYSVFSMRVNVIATVLPLLFFAISIVLYITLGIKNDTNNQLRDTSSASANTVSVIALMVAEIGGFGVLFTGFVAGLV